MELSSLPSILIGILVKNTKLNLDNLASQVIGLDYPKELLSIVFLEGDSEDGSYEHLKDIMPLFSDWKAAYLEKLDFGFKFLHELRHVEEKPQGPRQRQRLINLAKSRQYVVDKYLKDESFLWWVDSDYKVIPKDTLAKLLSYDKDMVIPLLKLEGREEAYDRSTDRKDMDIDNLAKTYPNQLVEVDYMSAHAIIKSKVFRAGANYSSDFNAPIIDQEGAVFTRKAKALGFKPYLATGCVIYHIPD